MEEHNPSFSKLLSVLESGKLETGHQLQTTARDLNQARSRLASVKLRYLEQQLLSVELEGMLSGQTQRPPAQCLATARLQHCFRQTDELLLGVTTEHLRAVDLIKGAQKIKKEVVADLETSLKSKVTKVLSWQSPQKEGIDNESLRLAKINQLPQLLRQQVAEEKRNKEEIEVTRREIVDTLAKKHKVVVEMCADLRAVLEGLKLGVVVEADRTAMEHTATQCSAMLGKLEVMYHQLLKGVCSEGRLQALKEIKSHLEAARGKLDERLVQTRLMMGHYQSLGEAFSELAEQYHEILTDIENKQWALTELSKTTS